MSLPTIDKDAPIFTPAYEYQESTLQLPFGDFSIFSELKANRVGPIEAMVTLTLCYRSKWSTGQTWRTSSRKLSDLLHISHRYIRDALAKATDWIQRKTAPKGNIAGTFQLTHHNCHALLVPRVVRSFLFTPSARLVLLIVKLVLLVCLYFSLNCRQHKAVVGSLYGQCHLCFAV